MLDVLWPQQSLDLTIRQDLLQTLFEHLDYMIKPLYGKLIEGVTNPRFYKDNRKLHKNAKGISLCFEEKDILQNLTKIMNIIGVHISLNHLSYFNLLKLFMNLSNNK